MPLLFGSVESGLHEPLQLVWPVGQHMPELQAVPVPHGVQLPQ